METDLYADLYFLINASMDLLCLMISASLLHRRLGRLRGLLAAALGGGYALLSLLLGWDGLGGFFADVLAAFLLCALATGTRHGFWRATLRITPVFLFVSMTLGGIMTALYSCLNRLQLPFDAWEGENLSAWSFALVGCLAALVTAKGGRFWKRAKKTVTVQIEAVLFGTSVTLYALEDTGNLLRDPVSGKSVIVADLAALASALPPILVQACHRGDCTHWLTQGGDDARRTRPVVAHTAGGQRLLLAILPDALYITKHGERYAADYLIAPTPMPNALPTGLNAVIAAD
ncbi:MAG: sigma-E processing peptidase SpoIIGA [Clostridia bacterium]|nr:sigma-E processing peptidase SpoIIGA [Clostridia bacterium]